MQNNKTKLHIQGMHCKACAMLIEHTLSEVSYIKKVSVNSNTHVVEIEVDQSIRRSHNFSVIPDSVRNPVRENQDSNSDARLDSGLCRNDNTRDDDAVLASELSSLLKKDGYTLSVEKQKNNASWRDFTYAVPIALFVIAVFVFLQKIGLVNLISAEKVSYPVAFVIGLVASVSSCLAVVGGLLLSVSANYAKREEKIKPQVLFHFGRLISFFVFGGIIGAIGSAFTLSVTATFILSLFVGFVMLGLGLNLLEVFPWAKKLQFHLPKKFALGTHAVKNLEFGLMPFLVGVATFFLPCGFTQSMQIYSLGTGSFLTGALTMTFFALGTLPVLSLISFTSVRFGKGKFASIFFKSAGILVIAFGLFTMLNGLVAKGLIVPFLNI